MCLTSLSPVLIEDFEILDEFLELWPLKPLGILVGSHRAGRHFRKKLMSRYIGSSPNGRFDVRFEELVSKAENPGGFLRKNVF